MFSMGGGSGGPMGGPSSMASNVSVSVPIWFTLIRIEFATPSSIPRCSVLLSVTNRSSPTSCTRSPIAAVNSFQPSQSFWSMPSSIETIG